MRVLVDAEGTPVGRFDRQKAEEVYDDTDTNGEGRILLRTAGGRLVLAVVSQWANVPPVYMVDDEAVIDFCRANNLDLPDGTGEALENLDAGGRPEIGPASSLRFQPELLADVDAAAERSGISRAEWVRRAAQQVLRAPETTGHRLEVGLQISGKIAGLLLQAVLADDLHVDQHGNTDLETVWQIGNILLFAGESQSSTTEAEVFSDDESAAAEFARRFENMKAMEAEAKAEWAESHAQ